MKFSGMKRSRHTQNYYDQGYKRKEMNIFYEIWAIHSFKFFSWHFYLLRSLSLLKSQRIWTNLFLPLDMINKYRSTTKIWISYVPKCNTKKYFHLTFPFLLIPFASLIKESMNLTTLNIPENLKFCSCKQFR